MSRRHTTDLRWNALLNDFRQSGLTHAEFCRRREIPLIAFRSRLYRSQHSTPALNDHASSTSADRRFLPVTIIPNPTSSVPAAQPHLEVILANGRRIAVTPGFDSHTLLRLIAVVE